ncbi:hypothetical protein CCC_02461 [Paramagnetospirillum magnetotacticum MS-1]|uniref:Uncharacterized protein n=1 Tax=Paramagnetospirillum magnetotacticum MS-1 TaxID=272627 RepID=A0A0C2V1P7_PARME|nr:hypothetical protein [Paramagnetospirillum magnetotacticum]KIL99011.1 hypothetical protein CCC_02461 [Paramagnetospirillum magnetotacticum MS-1]
MRRFLSLSAAFCLCTPAVMAQGASGSSGPVVITISKLDCSRVISHTPAPDVAYKPGVDVRGKPVVSADTDPGREAFAKKVLPEVLEIPITINPMTYNKAKTANKNKAAAASAVASNTTAITTAKAQGTALNTQLTSLNSQKTALTTTYNSDTAALIANTGGAGATDPGLLRVRAARQKTIDDAYNTKLASINSQITTTNTAITANTTTVSDLQTKDTTLRQQYTDTNMATEGTLAGLSGKGLDSTSMKVGVVKYDIARNSFTFNDEPMVSEDQRALAEACSKRGVR